MNGLLYVVGGDDGSCNLASVEYYNPVTDKWTLLPTNMSTGRSYAGQCAPPHPYPNTRARDGVGQVGPRSVCLAWDQVPPPGMAEIVTCHHSFMLCPQQIPKINTPFPSEVEGSLRTLLNSVPGNPFQLISVVIRGFRISLPFLTSLQNQEVQDNVHVSDKRNVLHRL